MNKYNELIDNIRNLKSVVVAFSGGVDSTFLAYAAKEALGEKAVAITMDTPYIPRWELEEAKILANKIGIKHIIVQLDINESIKHNPSNRCYLCKSLIFSTIMAEGKKLNMNTVIDGSNFDDTKDYRPGLVALKELEVKSPLMECEWTKDMIRQKSKEVGLDTHDKPAYACLLTRIPYDTIISREELERIEKSEVYMMSLGFKAVRVRSHGDIARIEIPKDKRKELFDTQLLDQISDQLKSYGYKYVAVEASGYSMGSLNKQIGVTHE